MRKELSSYSQNSRGRESSTWGDNHGYCILLTKDWKVEFLHTKRDGYKVAHVLAAEAAEQVDERVVYITVPNHAKEVFIKDKEFVASSS